MSKLIALLSIALCWAMLTGIWLAILNPIQTKKHGRPNRNLFRFGLDFLSYNFFDLNLNADKLSTSLSFCHIRRIAGYKDGEIIAPFTIAGACNRKVFETWIEFCLIPTLVVGDILIINNATFHHGGRVTEFFEGTSCTYFSRYLFVLA